MLRAIASTLGFALLFSIAACGGETAHPSTVKIPAASDDFEGKNYKDVVEDLKAAGFTRVETNKIPDLITGWLTKSGEVEIVKVNGKADFEENDRFPKDSKVVVSFHTFPKNEDDKSETPSANQSATPIAEPTETQAAEPNILTPQNNAELAAMLKVDPCDGPDFAFSKKYEGKTIAFNGSVAAMGPHGNTRYDIFIAPGNRGSNSVAGPTFQLRDVNMLDLNLTGKGPVYLGVDGRARFVTKVEGFDQGSCLFFLSPVETQVR